MKTLPLTSKDFAWTTWGKKEMEKHFEKGLEEKKNNLLQIKNILPELRTFENTVFALDRADILYMDVLSKASLLMDISPKESIREAAHKACDIYTPQSVDLDYDRELYIALVEYREGSYDDEKKSLTKEDCKLFEETI